MNPHASRGCDLPSDDQNGAKVKVPFNVISGNAGGGTIVNTVFTKVRVPAVLFRLTPAHGLTLTMLGAHNQVALTAPSADTKNTPTSPVLLSKVYVTVSPCSVPGFSSCHSTIVLAPPGGVITPDATNVPSTLAGAFATVSVPKPKLAVTVVSVVSVTRQVPVPEHPPPLQPVNPVPLAVTVTTVPLLRTAEHVAPQLIPPTSDVTVPVPATTTVSVGRLKLAVTVVAAVTVNLHVLVPEHPAPLHPVKFETLLGVAVITMAVPGK